MAMKWGGRLAQTCVTTIEWALQETQLLLSDKQLWNLVAVFMSDVVPSCAEPFAAYEVFQFADEIFLTKCIFKS